MLGSIFDHNGYMLALAFKFLSMWRDSRSELPDVVCVKRRECTTVFSKFVKDPAAFVSHFGNGGC